ncbi:MAG: hypothetical protein LWW91_11920, partial [Bacteroidales bacterium]|nr:hypothetical protein [Bacteroidales bacterium]
MKKSYQFITTLLLSVMALSTLVLFPSCDDNPDAYVITDGLPEVRYVRIPDVLSADSLLVSAFMGSNIAIIGKNLTSVTELWFNDQKAVLNTSLMTDKVIIVGVPSTIPGKVTNKMYLLNKDKDTVAFDF